jgi:hypothetical protein
MDRIKRSNVREWRHLLFGSRSNIGFCCFLFAVTVSFEVNLLIQTNFSFISYFYWYKRSFILSNDCFCSENIILIRCIRLFFSKKRTVVVGLLSWGSEKPKMHEYLKGVWLSVYATLTCTYLFIFADKIIFLTFTRMYFLLSNFSFLANFSNTH